MDGFNEIMFGVYPDLCLKKKIIEALPQNKLYRLFHKCLLLQATKLTENKNKTGCCGGCLGANTYKQFRKVLMENGLGEFDESPTTIFGKACLNNKYSDKNFSAKVE